MFRPRKLEVRVHAAAGLITGNRLRYSDFFSASCDSQGINELITRAEEYDFHA